MEMNRRGFLRSLSAGAALAAMPALAKRPDMELVTNGDLAVGSITYSSITSCRISVGPITTSRLSARRRLFGHHTKKLSRTERAVLADYQRALGYA